MVDGLSCVVEKSVDESDKITERYLAAHALTLVSRGRLMIETTDWGNYVVEAGQYVFLPRGLYMLTDIIPATDSFQATVYFFSEELLSDFLEKNHFQEPKLSLDNQRLLIAQQDDNLALFTQTLQTIYGNSKQNNAILARQKLLELLHLMSHGSQAREFIHRIQQLKRREKTSLRQFMEINFHKRLTIADYAYLTGRSVSTFQRDFKRLFNQPPKAWLTQVRLEKACALLEQHQLSIGEIGLEIGYDNLSHFIRVFRKFYGVTPKQYQINYRDQQVI